MAAIDRLMPLDGNPAALDLPVDEVLGLGEEMASDLLRQRMHATTLKELLAMRAGWPAGFDLDHIVEAGNGKRPPVPGDMLAYVRNRQTSFLTPKPKPLPNVYSSPSVVALSERLSQLFSPQDLDNAFVAGFTRFCQTPPGKVELRRETPQECEDRDMFPNHSSWAGGGWIEPLVGDPVFRAGVFAGYYLFDAGVGAFWMSAATLVRIGSSGGSVGA
jgi:hypothetical protein